MTVRRSIVAGWGGYLPDRIVSNAELAETVDTSDEWIVQRTGIRQRHVAAEGQFTSDLATRAARAALERADMDGNSVDVIIVATATPDETFPATATRVQAALENTKGVAFDVQAVCSGFIYALNIADNFIRMGQAETALVIGAETFSRILDWEDRATCVLFGDGAGAVLLQAHEGDGTNADRGILTNHIHSDGSHHDLLFTDGGTSSTQRAGCVRMVGKEVFRHAVTNLAGVVGEALTATGFTADQVDWVVPHQANNRILMSTCQKLGLDPKRLVVTVDRHANTSAASVPLALNEAASDGRIQRGQVIILEAMGAGFTWGASLLRW